MAGAKLRTIDSWDFASGSGGYEVTVVVNVFNNIEITLDCLSALHDSQFWNVNRFHVLVVDDASTDSTADTLRRIKGLDVLTLAENVGFLKAANAGMRAVKSGHVVLLNSDTAVQGAWLDGLLETVDRHPQAGIVGSRLVYPNGKIQEAGGIIFNDGSGWNYGRGYDLDDPRISFERLVDYCSGASILISRSLLDVTDGFDERFVPAYYEDTDLAFRARELGFEVWYQPASIVMHVEGVSHGTDEGQGIKKHQLINKEKFRAKWAGALSEQYPPNPAVVESARWRTEKGIVVVVDHEVPAPDRDSGSRRLVGIMKQLISLGFGVVFCPLNGWRRPGYVEELELLGIEVVGDPRENWTYLTSLESVRCFWICRPDAAIELIPHVRATLPQVRIIYDTVDLHFLREQRHADLTGDPDVANTAAETSRIEVGCADDADLVVVVSPVEKAILEDLTGTPVSVVPNVHATAVAQATPTGRTGLMFVGNFRHPPNVDGVVWFVTEILPIVRERHAGVLLRIVGAEAPQEIMDLAGDGVEVCGWVPDLVSAYEDSRVVVAPLRFGAGVKGKVGEAMENGVPIVLTNIAAEGMEVPGCLHELISDDPEEFARNVLLLLEDDESWTLQSQAGLSWARAQRSETSLTNALGRAGIE